MYVTVLALVVNVMKEKPNCSSIDYSSGFRQEDNFLCLPAKAKKE